MEYGRFYHIFKIFIVLNPFSWIRIHIMFAWIWIRISIKVRPGSGSVTNFFTSWIRIRIKMIQIRNTANDGFGSGMNESADKFKYILLRF